MKEHIPSWDIISVVGKLKVLNSAFFIFILLPLLLKFLNGINSISFKLLDKLYSLDLQPPFSWKLLYLSALLISIGNIIFHIFCPEIIRKYSSYDDYIKSGKSKIHLKRMLDKYYCIIHRTRVINYVVVFYQKFAKDYNITGYNIPVAYNCYINEDPISGSNYLFAKEILNYSYYFLRALISLIYLSGLAIFFYVVIQKILFTLTIIL